MLRPHLTDGTGPSRVTEAGIIGLVTRYGVRHAAVVKRRRMLLRDQLMRGVAVIPVAEALPQPPVEGLAAAEYRVVHRVDLLGDTGAVAAPVGKQRVARRYPRASFAADPFGFLVDVECHLGCLHIVVAGSTRCEHAAQ